MPVRSTRGEKLLRRPRSGRAAATTPIRITRVSGAAQRRPSRERRDLDPPLDRATYTCGCGLIFEASVNTTVGCPHCGDQQAW